MHLHEELKINCLKFISLNIISYLEHGHNLVALLALPVYLLRDLQNFIKIKSLDKYAAVSMDFLLMFFSSQSGNEELSIRRGHSISADADELLNELELGVSATLEESSLISKEEC